MHIPSHEYDNYFPFVKCVEFDLPCYKHDKGLFVNQMNVMSAAGLYLHTKLTALLQ